MSKNTERQARFRAGLADAGKVRKSFVVSKEANAMLDDIVASGIMGGPRMRNEVIERMIRAIHMHARK